MHASVIVCIIWPSSPVAGVVHVAETTIAPAARQVKLAIAAWVGVLKVGDFPVA
jgi:hypothetical protein